MVFSTDPNAEDIEAEYAALDRREVSSQGSRGGGEGCADCHKVHCNR